MTDEVRRPADPRAEHLRRRCHGHPEPRSTCRACGRSTTSTARISSSPRSRRRRSPLLAEASRTGPRHLRGDRRGRRARPAPLRLVHHLGAGLRRAGGARPGRARHQADAVPHLRPRQPMIRRCSTRPRRASRSSRSSSSRPASTRRPTSSGPARWRRPASTSPTGWSASRPTPRSPGGPQRVGHGPSLRPHRDRQLQRQDGTDLRGHRPAHRRPRPRRRTSATCSTSSPATPSSRSTASSSWPRRPSGHACWS
jgi:hypothetical protein